MVNFQQVGEILGRVCINGAEYDLCLKALRERSHGPAKDWDQYFRYVKHMIALQNGDFLYICSHQVDKGCPT